MSPLEFHARVLSYCTAMGASMTSGFRTLTHNKAVGGVAGSAHRFGLAADVVYDEPWPAATRVEMAKRLGLRCIVESDHDHLQPLTWTAG